MKPPISDPFPNPRAPQDGLNFRADFWSSPTGYFWSFLVFTTLVFSMLWPGVPRREVNIFFLVYLATTLAVTLICTALGLCYSVQLSATGVQGFNFWGLKREVSWPEITGVRGRWFVFRYAIISTSRKRNFIWLPLYLNDMPGFARAVEEVAPDGNALRLWLQKRGF